MYQKVFESYLNRERELTRYGISVDIAEEGLIGNIFKVIGNVIKSILGKISELLGKIFSGKGGEQHIPSQIKSRTDESSSYHDKKTENKSSPDDKMDNLKSKVNDLKKEVNEYGNKVDNTLNHGESIHRISNDVEDYLKLVNNLPGEINMFVLRVKSIIMEFNKNVKSDMELYSGIGFRFDSGKLDEIVTKLNAYKEKDPYVINEIKKKYSDKINAIRERALKTKSSLDSTIHEINEFFDNVPRNEDKYTNRESFISAFKKSINISAGNALKSLSKIQSFNVFG